MNRNVGTVLYLLCMENLEDGPGMSTSVKRGLE